MPERNYQKRNAQKEVSYAIEAGINSLMESHPLFQDKKDYIVKHVNNDAIKEKIKDVYEAAEARRLSEDERLDYVKEEIKKYIGTGAALDQVGKEIILKKGLEEKAGQGLLRKLFPKKKEEGWEYLDQTISAFQDLYSLFKSNEEDYTKRMPQVAKAITAVNDMGFLAPAIDVLKYYKMIDDRKYQMLKGNIKETVKKSSQEMVSGIERSITQDIAAGVFGIVGIALLFASRMNLTGGVIGIDMYEPSITLFHALAPLTISLILFWRNKKRISKKKLRKMKLKE